MYIYNAMHVPLACASNSSIDLFKLYHVLVVRINGGQFFIGCLTSTMGALLSNDKNNKYVCMEREIRRAVTWKLIWTIKLNIKSNEYNRQLSQIDA